jgi:AbrB family looped-hinge helix DNA binding protein
MKVVTVSSKFQVVIPREVREAMDLQPGTRFQVLRYENRIELIPLRELRSLRGFVRGIDTEVERSGDRV